MNEETKNINVPTKFNPVTQKYEIDTEELNKKVNEINSEEKSEVDKKNVEEEIKSEVSELKKEDPEIMEDKKAVKDKGSFTLIAIVMVGSLIIAGLWDRVPIIKNSVHKVLDPSVGALLDWQISVGMLIVVLIMTLITTLAQKYATDQKALKELKKEQKEIQNQMKEFKENPSKMMELQKKQFKMMPKQMKLSMRALVYTAVPFILLFRWFGDYFIKAEEITGGTVKLWPGISWFWFYLLSAIIFGMILRKYMDVV